MAAMAYQEIPKDTPAISSTFTVTWLTFVKPAHLSTKRAQICPNERTLKKDQFVSALALREKGMRSSLSTPNMTIEGISRQLRALSTSGIEGICLT